jgi:hypothetical protein
MKMSLLLKGVLAAIIVMGGCSQQSNNSTSHLMIGQTYDTSKWTYIVGDYDTGIKGMYKREGSTWTHTSNGKFVATFNEVETGKDSEGRPQTLLFDPQRKLYVYLYPYKAWFRYEGQSEWSALYDGNWAELKATLPWSAHLNNLCEFDVKVYWREGSGNKVYHGMVEKKVGEMLLQSNIGREWFFHRADDGSLWDSTIADREVEMGYNLCN